MSLRKTNESGKYKSYVLWFLSFFGGLARISDIGRFLAGVFKLDIDTGRTTAWRVCKALEKEGLVKIYSAKKRGVSALVKLLDNRKNSDRQHDTHFFNENFNIVKLLTELGVILFSEDGRGLGVRIGVFCGGRDGKRCWRPGVVVGLVRYGLWFVTVRYPVWVGCPPGWGKNIVAVREFDRKGVLHEHLVVRGRWNIKKLREYVIGKIFERLDKLYEWYPREVVDEIKGYYVEHGVYVNVRRIRTLEDARRIGLYLVKGASIGSRWKLKFFNAGLLFVRGLRWTRVHVSRSWLYAGLRDFEEYRAGLTKVGRAIWEFKRLEIYVINKTFPLYGVLSPPVASVILGV